MNHTRLFWSLCLQVHFLFSKFSYSNPYIKWHCGSFSFSSIRCSRKYLSIDWTRTKSVTSKGMVPITPSERKLRNKPWADVFLEVVLIHHMESVESFHQSSHSKALINRLQYARNTVWKDVEINMIEKKHRMNQHYNKTARTCKKEKWF